MRSLFTDAEWRETNADLLQNLPTVPLAVEKTITANPLPNPGEARRIFDL
jgi:hypothetical protein